MVDDARGPDEKVQDQDSVVIGQLILWKFEIRDWSLRKSPTIDVFGLASLDNFRRWLIRNWLVVTRSVG
jgi:hypothetical protein